tara:strand:+ start:1092 stop:1346 length:255 start_codon:yes stop_codon:yes gene_type:complete
MRTLRKTHRTKSNRKHVPAARKRYDGICSRLRGMRGDLTNENEVEIAYLLKDIEDYGFDFYPNHYNWERLDRLENIMNSALRTE